MRLECSDFKRKVHDCEFYLVATEGSSKAFKQGSGVMEVAGKHNLSGGNSRTNQSRERAEAEQPVRGYCDSPGYCEVIRAGTRELNMNNVKLETFHSFSHSFKKCLLITTSQEVR